jgi:hypothetical protein
MLFTIERVVLAAGEGPGWYCNSPSDSMPRIPIHRIINLARYPLLSLDSTAGRELLRTVRAELREHGCAVLPQFLHSDACAAGVAECEAGRANGDVFSKLRRHNVFMSAADPSLPPEHPVHRMQERTQGYIAHDQLGPSSARSTSGSR